MKATSGTGMTNDRAQLAQPSVALPFGRMFVFGIAIRAATFTTSVMPTCPFCAKQVPDESFVCPHCLRAQPIVIPSSTRAKSSTSRSLPGWLRPVLLVALLASLGAYVLRDYRRGPPPAEPEVYVAAPPTITIAPPLDVSIADSAAAKIPAGGHLSFRFSGQGRSGCRVRGAVQGLSGGDRRVNVLVVDRMGLEDVDAGRTPRNYYASGSTSAVELDIKLDGRTEYALVVADPSARGKGKTVRLRNIRADCAD